MFLLIISCYNLREVNKYLSSRLNYYSKCYTEACESIVSKNAMILDAENRLKTLKEALNISNHHYMVIERRDNMSVVRFDPEYPEVNILIKNFPYKEGDIEDRDSATFEATQLVEILSQK